MYYVVDIEEDWYIKGSKDHYEMSYTGDLDTAFRTQNKDTAFQVSDKCNENGIELRVVDRWFPSSKTCHCCKNIKKDLKLSDRIFKCDCGYIEDRDFNAALNLRDAMTYEVA